jgi:type IV pilus assembly protein PilY1
LNSRGKALSARNAVEYSNAVKSILSDIAAGNGSEAGVGVSQQTLPSIGSATKKYTPSFSSPAWNGDVLAENIDGNAVVTSTAWSAAAQLPLPASRNIFTYDPLAAAGSRGVEFKWSGLSTVMKAALSPTLIDGDLLVNYLRGDRTGEGLIYRKRTTPLGDIVNSTPALVFDQVDFYYEYLPYGFGGAAYRRFVRAKSLRQAQLFVGANDGMLHAFNDSTGAESFAFMPRSVLGSVNLLSKLDYSHRYFVDGPIQETDVFERSTNLWRNLIQATGGAGGKYVYTINVPVPYWAATSNTAPAALDAAASAPGAADIRWEVSDSTTGFGELGYVLTKPETGVTRDGTWITVFGNGYQSASGKAQLFIVNALTGALIKKIDTGVGSVASPNGLGGVGVVRDSQQQIVAVYAGDLAGNLWKFDLSSTSQSNWAVAFDGAPLFKAKNSAGQAEPVTAKPVFRAFPTGGVMVLFGAGKLFEQGDQSSTAGRTLYGVWDKVAIGDGAGTASDALADSSLLVTQNVTTAPVSGANSAVYRKLTVTPVDYATKRGWRLPLVIGVGERMVDDPQVRFDYVFMQSVTLTGVEDQCQSAKMIRRGYLLDPFMSGTLKPPFDVNGDGAYNYTDDANIVDLTGTGSNSVVAQTGSRTTCVGTNCTGAQTCPKSGLIIGAGSSGGIEACFGPNAIRRAWREIVTTP